MNKVVTSAEEAVQDIYDGARIMLSGFAGCGHPHNLIEALIKKGTKDLTFICTATSACMRFVENDRVKEIIAGFTSHPLRADITELIEAKVRSGVLKVENVPHGILSERIRAHKAGIVAFYTDIGVGTIFAEGKEVRTFDGEEYVLERALGADFALIKGYQGDRVGNVVCRLVARNRSVEMAGAATMTIAEVEHIVDVGEINPDHVTIPGIFVQRVVKGPRIIKWYDGHESI
jgi:3-oxoacid CoA-transferase A subunit